MEQYKKIVLEAPKGMNYTLDVGDDGELIIRLMADGSENVEEIKNLSEEVDDEKYRFFTKISKKERRIVEEWFLKQKPKNSRERRFLNRLREALEEINYTYWIATIDPGVRDGKIFYAKDEDAAIAHPCKEWKKMARNYSPERGSRLSDLKEIAIWYAICKIKGIRLKEYSDIVLDGDDDYSKILNLTNIDTGLIEFMVQKQALLPAELAMFATGVVVLTK